MQVMTMIMIMVMVVVIAIVEPTCKFLLHCHDDHGSTRSAK